MEENYLMSYVLKAMNEMGWDARWIDPSEYTTRIGRTLNLVVIEQLPLRNTS